MKMKYICIICPIACELIIKNNKVIGAKCKRGITFAGQEAKEPLRVFTSTIKYKNNNIYARIPIKTANPVPLIDFPYIAAKIHQIYIKEKPKLGTTINIEYKTKKQKNKKLLIITTGE
ncbi:DUF1667 domain-containing protein [Candidatus Margulisiibacteriota bacterium]